MGNIVLGVGSETTALVLQVTMLTITPHTLHNVIILSTPTCLCGSSPERNHTHNRWNCMSFKWSLNAYNYTHTGKSLACTYTGQVLNHSAHVL